MNTVLLIAMGGALGAVSRYAISGWTHGIMGESFPFGTLVVNLLGCFLLGVVQQAGVTTNLMSQEIRIAIAVGFLGALTTYSTFAYETLQQLQDGNSLVALCNVAIHLFFGVLAVWLGITAVRFVWGGA